MRRVERAAEAARALLARYPDLHRAPVDVHALAARMGVPVHEVALDADISGMLGRRGNFAVIAINESHHPHRKRFSLAHELGHFELHLPQVQGDAQFIDHLVVKRRDKRASEGNEPEEIEANAFAAELLMPEDLVLRAFPGGRAVNAWDVSEERVKQLARRFGVSQQAMSIRLINLGLWQVE